MSTIQSISTQLSGVGRKTTMVLFTTQSLASAGTIATATVLPIIGDELSGNPFWAGLPFATVQLAAAPFAFIWGVLWDRLGRRKGFTLAMMLGLIGMLVGAAAIEIGSLGLFLVGLIGYGAGRAASQLSRFIAAEVNPPSLRGRAISYVVLGGTVGAVGGPLLVAPSNRWAMGAGMAEMAGTFAVSVIIFGVAVVIAWLGLRPEPLEVSREIAALYPERESPGGITRSMIELGRQPSIFVAMAIMVLAQMVMIMVMGITSLYMRDNNHTLASISVVFSAHTLGMFAFSILSGRLSDQWGRGPVMISGGALLILSLALAPISTGVPSLALALFLLGLGWNFCFVAGSALLADHLSPAERSRTQGFNDLLIGLVSALGSLSSGFVFAWMGYAMVNMLGGVFVMVILALSIWWYMGTRKAYAPGD